MEPMEGSVGLLSVGMSLVMSFEVNLMSSVCEAVVLILMLLVIKCLFFEVKIDFDMLNSN